MNKDIIASKTELLNLLENYKSILHQDCIAYLNGLIELEFSILNTKFSQIVPDDFIEQVARYNIFNRAIKLATECNPQTEIIANRKKGQLYILYKGYKIFSYIIHFLEAEDTSDMIYLYQIIANPNLRQDELAKAKLRLQELKNEQNPYYQKPNKIIDAYYWELQRYRNAKAYKDKITNINKYTPLNNLDQNTISNVNKIYQKFIDDYGLTNTKFSEKKQFGFLPQYQSNMQKILTKKIDKLEVIKNIKYI